MRPFSGIGWVGWACGALLWVNTPQPMFWMRAGHTPGTMPIRGNREASESTGRNQPYCKDPDGSRPHVDSPFATAMPLSCPRSPVRCVALAAALLWAGHGAAMAQSVERGAALYAAHCSSCHSPDQHGDGPAHRGVVGRRAGALKDFDYSPALRASKILWTRATLKAWLTDPEALIPGQAMDYLSVRGWSNDTVNRLLAWMGDNQATGEDGARHFLRTQPELWKTWVSPEVAARVEAAL